MKRRINHDELAYLYNRIGEAIWHLQHVENALAPFIIIKGIAVERNSIDESTANEHLQKLNKMTLGQLIGRTRKLNIFEEPFLNRLTNFNNERKWVVHNSIFESGDQLYTDRGRELIFNRLDTFVDEAISLHKDIGNSLAEYCVSKGVNEQQINEHAINHLRKLKGEA